MTKRLLLFYNVMFYPHILAALNIEWVPGFYDFPPSPRLGLAWVRGPMLFSEEEVTKWLFGRLIHHTCALYGESTMSNEAFHLVLPVFW